MVKYFIKISNEILDLTCIDLSENQIETIPKELGELANLEQLSLRQNKIKELIVLEKCCKLKVKLKKIKFGCKFFINKIFSGLG